MFIKCSVCIQTRNRLRGATQMLRSVGCAACNSCGFIEPNLGPSQDPIVIAVDNGDVQAVAVFVKYGFYTTDIPFTPYQNHAYQDKASHGAETSIENVSYAINIAKSAQIIDVITSAIEEAKLSNSKKVSSSGDNNKYDTYYSMYRAYGSYRRYENSFLQAKVDQYTDPIVRAVSSGDLEGVTILAKYGFYTTWTITSIKNTESAVIKAISEKNTDIILIIANMIKNAINIGQKNLLLHAALRASLECDNTQALNIILPILYESKFPIGFHSIEQILRGLLKEGKNKPSCSSIIERCINNGCYEQIQDDNSELVIADKSVAPDLSLAASSQKILELKAQPELARADILRLEQEVASLKSVVYKKETALPWSPNILPLFQSGAYASEELTPPPAPGLYSFLDYGC